MKIALLIVDLQPVYLEEEPLEASVLNSACMYINYVANLLRSNGQPVFHIQDIQDRTEENKHRYEVIPDIVIHPEDRRVTKVYSNAFWKTELEKELRELKVGMVIVAGFAAEHCVLFTYNGAMERDFKAAILQNGILSTKQEVIPATYRDRNLISYPVIEHLIANEQ
ncbi:isochorismatase family cysteine hydrolase [Gorillibacterium sp. CAU 1737]|uniref:cysteine hydrolase family protein n=1 Tax=Gorillibacterium sp. CAU 1737 TaxID=3140362 RepID=UPI00325FEF72